ncbi:helix-hairpin-helix domain-containing protein, partial [Anabaenopsis elenkinii]
MTPLTCVSTGKSINLLSELANSGEAKVWRTDHSGYLAKIYHQSTPERMQKLAVMIDYPPPDPNHHINHISFAWPRSVLKNAQGDLVGFLMGEIRGGKEIYDVYHPLRRNKICKLPADWRFLHYTARNIASIIKVLHHQGYVLGDIKPQNILVNDQALPSIIDTDSFQVRHPHTGKVHRCLVGTPEYTPPELIGQDFATIEQTEIHDRFRLGVIIHQLLFSGQNLYAGRWKGAGEPPEPGDYIRQGIWLYSPHQLLEPVDRTIPLEILHPQVKSCFLRCFNDGYKNPNLRPSAEEWFQALKVASESLILCKQVKSHYYSQSYGSCYWCDRVSKIGVEIFPGSVKVQPSPPNYAPQSQPVTTATTQTSPSAKVTTSPSGNSSPRTLTGHSKPVLSVGFSPDGQTLASGSHDNTIKLWDV